MSKTPETRSSACAGYAALIVAGYSEADARRGADEDFAKAEDLIERWQLGTQAEWLARAVEFMRQPANVRAVEMLADRLLEHRRLNEEYADNLISLADGEWTKEEWEAWEAFHWGYRDTPLTQEELDRR
jgi:hypothetical protein